MIYEDDDLQEEKPSHISYKEYKKKLKNNPREGLILFVSAFFVMLLLFLGVVKQISPDVDVTIGGDDKYSKEEVVQGEVDNRLSEIQNEDNIIKDAADGTFSPELDEKVVLPKEKRKTVGEAEVIVLDKPNEHKTEGTDSKPVVVQPVVNAKVIVGYYATPEQAEVARSIIKDSGLNVQPFVKNIGTAYTLQVGSFTSRDKAQGVANDLLKNNFPARVIIEN